VKQLSPATFAACCPSPKSRWVPRCCFADRAVPLVVRWCRLVGVSVRSGQDRIGQPALHEPAIPGRNSRPSCPSAKDIWLVGAGGLTLILAALVTRAHHRPIKCHHS